MSDQSEEAKLPSFEKILLDTSLYAPLPFTEVDREKLETLQGLSFQIDAYCLKCQRSSIFKTMRSYGGGSGQRARDSDWITKPRQFSAHIHCQRCQTDYSYYFMIAGRALIKVGQFPSLEDIGSADILKYRGVLRNEDFLELRKAGGLFSHGIGIGSFVYLRRIFERLIEAHRAEYEEANGPIEDYARKRMDDRIRALSSVLPKALVESRAAYGILSAGIHELSEDQCKAYFPVLRAAIIQILEQDLRNKEEARVAADLARELKAIEAQLKG